MSEQTQYYKVLQGGQSFHGGSLAWSLPTRGDGGAWTPGAWHEVAGDIVVCRNGLHLTSAPINWMKAGATVYRAEHDGETDTDGDDKIAARRARLLRPATSAELAALRIFDSGEHAVSEGLAWAFDSATVEAFGSATVRASGSATVRASGSATVRAFGSTTVEASGSATVTSPEYCGSGNVTVSDSAVWIDRRQSRPRIVVGGVEYAPKEA